MQPRRPGRPGPCGGGEQACRTLPGHSRLGELGPSRTRMRPDSAGEHAAAAASANPGGQVAARYVAAGTRAEVLGISPMCSPRCVGAWDSGWRRARQGVPAAKRTALARHALRRVRRVAGRGSLPQPAALRTGPRARQLCRRGRRRCTPIGPAAGEEVSGPGWAHRAAGLPGPGCHGSVLLAAGPGFLHLASVAGIGQAGGDAVGAVFGGAQAGPMPRGRILGMRKVCR